MANPNNLEKAHKLKEESRALNLAVVYLHLKDEPSIAVNLAIKMNLTPHIIMEYCRHLETEGYLWSEFIAEGRARSKLYHTTEKDNFPWPKQCKDLTNLKRAYFDANYPGIHQELRDAIYEGRISPDIIRSHKELETDHWVIPKKDGAKYRGNFQSSLSGEYSA